MLYALLLLITFGCHNKASNEGGSNISLEILEKNEMTKQDSIKRPSNLSKASVLVDLGEMGYPDYMWIEYTGLMSGKKLKTFFVDKRADNILDKEIFENIHIFNFYDVKGNLERSAPFQVVIGEGAFKIDYSSFNLELIWGTSSLLIKNNGEEYVMVQIFNTDKPFTSKQRLGVRFVKVPSIEKMYADWLERETYSRGSIFNISIREETKGVYAVLLVDEFSREKTQKYKLFDPSGKDVTLDLIRYYDPKIDRIYLLEENSYLYPVD